MSLKADGFCLAQEHVSFIKCRLHGRLFCCVNKRNRKKTPHQEIIGTSGIRVLRFSRQPHRTGGKGGRLDGVRDSEEGGGGGGALFVPTNKRGKRKDNSKTERPHRLGR